MKNFGEENDDPRIDEIIREIQEETQSEVTEVTTERIAENKPRRRIHQEGKPMKAHNAPSEVLPKIGISVAAITAVCLLGLFGYTYLYQSIFPGVTAGTVSVGGMKVNAAAGAIAQHYETIEAQDETLTVKVSDKEFSINVGDVTGGVDSMNSARNAFQYGRTGNPFERVAAVLSARFKGASTELNLAVDDAGLKEKLRALTDEATSEVGTASYELEDTKIILDLGKQGIKFDRDAVEKTLAEKLRHMDFTPYQVEAEITDPAQVDFAELKAKIDKEAKSATVDHTTGKIVDEVEGVTIELADLQSAVGDKRTGIFTIPVTRTPAKVTASELKKVLFRDELATSSTKVTSNQNRTNNVRLAASAFNGTILNPGEEFSYNGAVGQRTIERGYKEAGAYVQGKVVDEVGGGVCQPSSTLYMAALKADLKVSERHNHTYVSSYTPFGEDAMVSWGGPDFKIVNNTDYPIKIESEQSGMYMKIRLIGTKTDDKTVTTKSEVLSTTPFETVYKEDASIASGTQKVEQTGSIGYKTVTYKYITQNGKTTKEKANTSTYRKRDKIILVHPGEKGAKPAEKPTGSTTNNPTTTPTEPATKPTTDTEPAMPTVDANDPEAN